MNFAIENEILEIDNNHSFLSELEKEFSSYWNSSYLNKESRSDDSHYDYSMYDNKYSWNNYINSCIDSYLHSQIGIDSRFTRFRGHNHYPNHYVGEMAEWLKA